MTTTTKSNPDQIRGRGKATKALSATILEVLADFDGSMSSRQVYYQAVSRGAIENCQKSYGRVARLLVDMRRNGAVPYSRIVDRTRLRHQRATWEGTQEILTAVSQQYKRNLWAEQDTVVQIACEKQALEGIFAEVVDEYGASLWTLRGYPSDSFAFDWANEINRLTNDGKEVVIAYFGDWDPSGLNIEQTTVAKLRSFDAEFSWSRAGLLLEDFEAYELVPIPTKDTDARTKAFRVRHGERAAELDALRPDVLRERIESHIRRWIESDAWERLEATEAVEKQSLNEIVSFWNVASKAAHRAARSAGAA